MRLTLTKVVPLLIKLSQTTYSNFPTALEGSALELAV